MAKEIILSGIYTKKKKNNNNNKNKVNPELKYKNPWDNTILLLTLLRISISILNRPQDQDIRGKQEGQRISF